MEIGYQNYWDTIEGINLLNNLVIRSISFWKLRWYKFKFRKLEKLLVAG